MTERLPEVEARISGVRQLGAVVNALRGIAAACARQARGELVAVDSYATTIAIAVGRALALMSSTPPPAATRPRHCTALVLFCAEQGFAGAFSERVLDAVGVADLAASELYLIGTRGGSVIAGRGMAAAWKCAMPTHSPGVPKLANRIAEALYARIATGDIDCLEVVFAVWEPGRGSHVKRQRLFPYDLTQFPRPTDSNAPLVNLTAEELLGDLTADYLHAQLCNAALNAFAAENEARMEAMAAARNQIEHQLASLCATQRQVRQEAITAEIIELAVGEETSRR